MLSRFCLLSSKAMCRNLIFFSFDQPARFNEINSHFLNTSKINGNIISYWFLQLSIWQVFNILLISNLLRSQQNYKILSKIQVLSFCWDPAPGKFS